MSATEAHEARLLHEASMAMRENAEAVRGDAEFVNRWEAKPTIDPENTGWVVAHDWEADYDSTVAHLPYDYEGDLAKHLALFGHPVVALAVADWLYAAWERAQVTSLVRLEHDAEERDWYLPALAIARAYLAIEVTS